MCHRHTHSSKRNLSSKIFAKSAATCFLPLTKDFNTFYPGPANTWSASFLVRPDLVPLVCRPMVTSLPLPAPVRPVQPRAAPACACPFLSACSFLPTRPCLLRHLPLVPAAAPAPVPACLPSDGHQLALSCARRSLSVPLCDGSLPLPTSSRQATRPAIRFCSSRATIFRPLRFPSLSLAPLPHLPQLALSCLSLQPLPHLRLSAPVRPVPPRAVRTRPLSAHASF